MKAILPFLTSCFLVACGHSQAKETAGPMDATKKAVANDSSDSITFKKLSVMPDHDTEEMKTEDSNENERIIDDATLAKYKQRDAEQKKDYESEESVSLGETDPALERRKSSWDKFVDAWRELERDQR